MTFHAHFIMLFRLWFSTAVHAAAELCTEETCRLTESATMLQMAGRSTGGIAAGQSGQAAGLYTATVKLLIKGTTPEVVTFSEKAVQDIETTVYEAMDNAHKEDQAELDQLSADLEQIRADNQQHVQDLVTLAGKVTDAKRLHDDCRLKEATSCRKYHEEEEKRKTFWKLFQEADKEFRLTTDEQQWCGDTEIDMEAQNTAFKLYESKGKSRFDAWDDHEAQRVKAFGFLKELEDQSAECKSQQTHFERTSCERHSKWEATTEAISVRWKQGLQAYNLLKHGVAKKTADRNAEFSTLEEVKCLLSGVKDRGGKPCEEQQDGTSNEANQVIQACKNQARSAKYVIQYPAPASQPEALAEPSKPCDEKFVDDEYGSYKNDAKCFENFPQCVACR